MQHAPAWEEGEPEQEIEALPGPLRLELAPDASLVAEDWHEYGSAVYLDSRLGHLTSSVSYLLKDLLEDPSSEVVITHDQEWDQFPEIGEALQQAGGEERAMCVAYCEPLGFWGVGLGGKIKQRENMARLALCVSLIENNEAKDQIFADYPDYAAFCGMPQTSTSQKKRRTEKAIPHPQQERVGRPPPQQADTAESGYFPKDVPIWIKLPVDELMPEELDGLLPEALAVSCGGSRKGLYSRADEVLESVLPGCKEENLIDYLDDPDWSKFPMVGMALKEVAEKEECMCVAVCPSRSAWAVGIAGKGKTRWQAAKVAIAATLLWEEEEPIVESPDMIDFVEEARQAREDMGW